MYKMSQINPMAEPAKILDARRLLCPMPVIRIQKQMKELQAGDILKVFCTDPGTLQDIPTWCRMYGHDILNTEESATEIIFFIQKSLA